MDRKSFTYETKIEFKSWIFKNQQNGSIRNIRGMLLLDYNNGKEMQEVKNQLKKCTIIAQK